MGNGTKRSRLRVSTKLNSRLSAEFETIIETRASLLFPELHLVPFKVPVESEHGRKIPDLALIDRRYRRWWVVEIEMAHHSLNGHVLPQVEVFVQGTYGPDHAQYMVSQSTALSLPALTDMIKGSQPQVVVIVNRNTPDWITPIHRLGALLSVVEVFRSERNQHVLRINGDYPAGDSAELVSACRLDNVLKRFLKIESPAALRIDAGEIISIRYGDGTTTWSWIDSADQVWLCPVERHPLVEDRDYHIFRDEVGQLYFNQPT